MDVRSGFRESKIPPTLGIKVTPRAGWMALGSETANQEIEYNSKWEQHGYHGYPIHILLQFCMLFEGAHFKIDRVIMVWISCIFFWDRWQNCKLTSLNWRYYGLLWHTLEICAPGAIDCQSYIREHTHSSWTTMDSLWFRPFLLRSDERSEAGSGCCILWKCDLKLGPSKENCAHGKINGFASGCYVKI